MIPETIQDAVFDVLRTWGDDTPVRAVIPASPGGVSDTLRLKTDMSEYFLKWNNSPWCGTFTNEAFHLGLIRGTQTVRVPDVVGYAEGGEGEPAWMLQNWLDATMQDKERLLGARLGERMAAFHRATANSMPGYGYTSRNEDGSAQPTTGDWAAFIADAYGHHLRQAREQNRWTPERNRLADRLMERLPELMGSVNRAPTMLHGDLHGCNVRLMEDGEPVVVDPWLFYGDREKEIVSTMVSGDFPPSFYEAYNAHYPLEPGFEERADLYKLSWYWSGLYYSADPTDGTSNAIADPILKRYVG